MESDGRAACAPIGLAARVKSRGAGIVATFTSVVLSGLLLGSCSSSPPRDVTPSPSPEVQAMTVDVYFVVDTRVGLRLARERHDVPERTAVEAATTAMVHGADDPDYATTWDPRTRILGVRRHGGEVTVNLSADARRANVGSAGAALMIQQLVHTVTSAAPGTDRVMLLIDGSPAGDLWGAVTWDRPVQREGPLDVRQLVQLDAPRDQAVVTSPVVVSGEAAVFEAVLPWRVVDRQGRTVKSGTAMTAEGQRFAPFRFEVALPPGSYTIEISEDDPSDGAAGTPMVDTREVTVRG